MDAPAALAALALLLVGCGGTPDNLADCREIDCHQAVAIDLLERDPALLAAQFASLEDPLSQLAVVEAVATVRPEDLSALCRLMEEGPDAARCGRLSSRTHLRRVSVESAPTPVAATADGITGLPIPHPSLTTELARQPAEEVPRADDVPLRTSQMTAATARAGAGQARAAAAACQAVPSPIWRSECFFRSAEAMLEARGMAGLDGSVELCLASGGFTPRCLEHLAIRLSARLAPRRGSADWSALNGAVEQVAASFGAQDPVFAAALEEHLTARTIHNWYRDIRQLTGDPLDQLPPAAAPHVRASLAVLLVERAPTARLEALTAELLAAFEARNNLDPAAASEDLSRPTVGNQIRRTTLWCLTDTVRPESAQAIWLGTSRRALAQDSRADAAICILEAAARLSSVPLPLLEEGLQQSDPAVRWTAARLLLLLDPAPGREDALAEDEDPAIRALTALLEPGGSPAGKPAGRGARSPARGTCGAPR
ncbi:MAG: hypothetical protein ABIO70_29400 [Pseudomonadota bacterium]